MVFRIIFLVAIVIGMGVFLYDKWSEDDQTTDTVNSTAPAIVDPVTAIRNKPPAPRRPNSTGIIGVGYKYEYQDESGKWIPVMDFSQIPARYRGHFRPLSPRPASAAASARPASAGTQQTGNQPQPPQPGAASSDTDKDKKQDSGPSAAEEELSEFQKKQAEDEKMYKEWGARCRALAAQLNEAQKAYDEIKDRIPPCQLKEEDCYQKYDEYKANLLKDIGNLNRDYNECREGARKAGVPPGYLR